MTRRQTAPIIITLALIGVAMALLLGRGTASTPDVSAQVVADACTKTTSATHIDLSTTHIGKSLTGGGADSTAEAKIRIAGPDFHYAAQTSDGQPFTTAEAIYLDGVVYGRVEDGPWEVAHDIDSKNLARMLSLQPAADGSWDLCPQVTNIEKLGPEMLDGVATTHYKSVSEEFTKAGKDDVYIGVTLRYWLNEEGLLVQFQMDVEHHHGDQAVLNRTTTKVSGVGEPNVITAPTVGE